MSATLPFEGTDITVYGTLNGQYSDLKPLGYFQVDSGENHTVVASDIPNETTLNDGSILRNQPLFSATGLTPGQHTLTLVVPPNPASATPSNPIWYLDYAVYGPVASSGSGSSSSPSGSSLSLSPSLSPSSPSLSSLSPPLFLTSTPSGSSSSPSSPLPLAPAPANVGAIAGGVVAGAIVISAFVLALFLWQRKRRGVTKEDIHQFPLSTPGTPYRNLESSSKVELGERPSSILKPMGLLPQSPISPATSSGLVESLPMDQSTNSGSSARRSSRRGDGLLMGTGSGTPNTLFSEQESRTTGSRRLRREEDGGVRLTSASDEEEEEEVLPPSYARYG